MRKVIAAAVLAGAALGGCALNKPRAPDEFAVARNAPLIVPPDFNLAPPVAGTAGLSAGEAQQQAIDRIFASQNFQRLHGGERILDLPLRQTASMLRDDV